MSEQNPYNSQNPYNAPQPYYPGSTPQPSSYEAAPQAPGQAPYVPSAGQAPYAPSAGQAPYAAGMPAAAAGANPYAYPGAGVGPVPGTTRPGQATGASVLAIISGSLGLILGIIAIVGISALQGASALLGGSLGTILVLRSLQAFAIFFTAVALLASGIMFLKGSGHKILFAAAIAQAVLTILDPIISWIGAAQISTELANAATSTSAMWTFFVIVVGLGLAGTTIFLVQSPQARAWSK